MLFRKFFFISITLFSFFSCQKDKVTKSGELLVRTQNEFDQSLSDVSLILENNSFRVIELTGAEGEKLFEELPVGDYTIRIEKEGYISQSHEILINPDIQTEKDFRLIAGETTLAISDTLFHVSSNKSNKDFTVSSNAIWNVKVNAPWVTTSISQGEGEKEVEINWDNYEGDSPRKAIIEITTGSLEKEIRIIQEPPVKVLKTTGILGNMVNQTTDSVSVIFNQEIKVKGLTSEVDYCVSEINYKYASENREIRFSYGCGELGGTYPFTINLEDKLGQNYSKSIDVDFFSKGIKIQGQIKDYYVEDDNNSYWVITFSPNNIYEIDLSSLEVKRVIKLKANSEPIKFTLNEYNQKFYCLYKREYAIQVVDKISGSEERNIIIRPDNHDHPQSPKIYPDNIGFTQSGVGIVIMNDDRGNRRWKFIDSANQDSIWHDEQLSQENNIGNIYSSFDKTKLLLTGRYGTALIMIFNPQNFSFTNYLPPSTTRGVFIKPHRQNNRIYSAQLYNQLIVDPTSNYSSKESFLDNRDQGTADFSYKSGESEVIYFCDAYNFQVLDYSSQQTLIWYSVIAGLEGATSTLDGQHFILFKRGKNYIGGTTDFESQVIQINTDIL